MIQNTIETLKNAIEKLPIDAGLKIELFKLTTTIKAELLKYDVDLMNMSNRHDIYAEILNKIHSQIIESKY